MIAFGTAAPLKTPLIGPPGRNPGDIAWSPPGQIAVFRNHRDDCRGISHWVRWGSARSFKETFDEYMELDGPHRVETDSKYWLTLCSKIPACAK